MEASSSGVAPRGAVPLMGSVQARDPSRRRKRSGDRERSWKDPVVQVRREGGLGGPRPVPPEGERVAVHEGREATGEVHLVDLSGILQIHDAPHALFECGPVQRACRGPLWGLGIAEGKGRHLVRPYGAGGAEEEPADPGQVEVVEGGMGEALHKPPKVVVEGPREAGRGVPQP